MIYYAQCHTSRIDIHKLHLRENNHHLSALQQIPFLNELVFNFEMNAASLQAWKGSLGEGSKRSVCDVLRERQARINNDTVI